ncbi:hypothetical protein [uncultured Pseudodesulfovibrio sp.]|uniref:hypothetical protein n=1 Tax=uncultured Pseudodesulfovibrio sp. TaxID=2035858 RepID=UPI0029C80F82|nr:hypothetical protein [uncultured Pseudodesulfovibrio sp.]
MNMNETLIMVATMLAPAFFSLLGMAAFGSPVVAVLGEIAAKAKKRVFYDKYGQQTSSMGLILLILTLVVCGAGVGIAFAKFPEFIKKFINPTSPLKYAFIGMGVFALFTFIHSLSWKKMRSAKGFHIVLGLIAALGGLAAVTIAVPAKLLIGQTAADPAQAAYNAQALQLPMAIMYAILTIAAAAGLSCAYLVLRRNKDDFGRDYYNFTLKLAARWAAIPMVGFLACQGWMFATLPESFKTMTMGTPLGFVWAGATAIGAICTILWLIIARSAAPLQLKGLTFLAALLMWLMHALNVTLFMNFMSMF